MPNLNCLYYSCSIICACFGLSMWCICLGLSMRCMCLRPSSEFGIKQRQAAILLDNIYCKLQCVWSGRLDCTLNVQRWCTVYIKCTEMMYCISSVYCNNYWRSSAVECVVESARDGKYGYGTVPKWTASTKLRKVPSHSSRSAEYRGTPRYSVHVNL